MKNGVAVNTDFNRRLPAYLSQPHPYIVIIPQLQVLKMSVALIIQ